MPSVRLNEWAGAAAAGGKNAAGAPIAGVNGNWACTACGNINFGSRTHCNRCGTPNMTQVAVPTMPNGGKGGGAPVAGVNGNWACLQCGNVNFPSRTACNRCGAPKPEEEQVAMQQVQQFQPPVISVPARGGAPVAGVNGNWACVQCGNVNFPSRTACNRCGAPKPEEEFAVQTQQFHQPQVQVPVQVPARAGGPPIAGVNGNWACDQCGNVNFPSRTVCNRCGAPKPEEVQQIQPQLQQFQQQQYAGPARTPSGRPIAGVNGNWECTSCGNVNFPSRDACNRCGAPKPEEAAAAQMWAPGAGAMPAMAGTNGRGAPIAGVNGNWLCDQCGNVNFPSRTACNRCGAPKPEELDQALEQLQAVEEVQEPVAKRYKWTS